MNRILNIFSGGIMDALSLYIPPALIIDNYNILKQYGIILGSNITLLAGVITVYYYGISPIIAQYTTPSEISMLSYYLMHGLWIIPICLYCQLTAPKKYQIIVDYILEHIYKSKKEPKSILKYIADSSYGVVVWLSYLIQMQIFATVIPMIINLLISSAISSNLHPILIHISRLSSIFGDILSCFLYSWYCFDPRWNSEGKDPDTRLSIIEKNWPYFFGYGLPFILINKIFTGFWSYGVFLMYFPLAIMIASTVEYDYYTKVQADNIPIIRVFWSAQMLSKELVMFIERKRKAKMNHEDEEASKND